MSNYWGFVCLTCNQACPYMERINHGEDALLAMVRVSRALADTYPDLDLDVQVAERWVPLAWLSVHRDHDLWLEGSYAGDLIKVPQEVPMNATTRRELLLAARTHLEGADQMIGDASSVPGYVLDLVSASHAILKVLMDDQPMIARALTAEQRQRVEGGF